MQALASGAIIPITFETVLFLDPHFRNGHVSSGLPKKRLLRILAAASRVFLFIPHRDFSSVARNECFCGTR